MLLATECRCARPRVFEAGWCHACGRLLVVEPEFTENLDAWLRLDLTIQREQARVRALRAELGLTDVEYSEWLRNNLALSEEIASLGASRASTSPVPG